MEIPLDISVLFNMRQFVKYSRLKQFALRVSVVFSEESKLYEIIVCLKGGLLCLQALASTLDEEVLSDLKDQFHAIDVDKNGTISLEEMREVYLLF